jgi:nitrogen fixation NifU-like protein
MEMKIYNDIIIDHHLHPRHLHEPEHATLSLMGSDAVCGDMLTLHLSVDGNRITDGSFTGVGCAFSQASADMMLDLVIGGTAQRAKYLYGIFSGMMDGTITDGLDDIGNAAVFGAAADISSRKRCVMLCWDTLMDMLDTLNERRETLRNEDLYKS